jgi:hypothetical protein
MNLFSQSVISSLDSRKRAVSRSLETLCTLPSISGLFKRFRSWAIVGGAVRDLLLVRDIHHSHFMFDFPDVDIAVDKAIPKGYFDKLLGDVHVATNSFGGIKLRSPNLGVIDIWAWESRSGFESTLLKERLPYVDFGMNSVAFVWPQREILIHERWITDVKALVVEKLDTPKVQFLIVRGCALAAKLEKIAKRKIPLGPRVSEDFRDIIDRDDAEWHSSIRYLKSKVVSGRWDSYAAVYFAKVATKLRPHCANRLAQEGLIAACRSASSRVLVSKILAEAATSDSSGFRPLREEWQQLLSAPTSELPHDSESNVGLML